MHPSKAEQAGTDKLLSSFNVLLTAPKITAAAIRLAPGNCDILLDLQAVVKHGKGSWRISIQLTCRSG